jgi:hypothetical protein
MDCFVFSFLDSNIFRSSTSSFDATIYSTLTFRCIATRQAAIPRNDAFQVASKMVDLIKLNFDVPVPWDINSLAKDYANWITHSGSTTLTSKTGILCTKNFQRLAARALGDVFCLEFRILLWTSSLIYVLQAQDWHSPQFSLEGLQKTRNNVGTKVLSKLEEVCRPETLRNLKAIERKALFLVIVGTSLSVTYMGSLQGWSLSGNVSSTQSFPKKSLIRFSCLAGLQKLVVGSPSTY